MYKYEIIFYWSNADGVFVAEAPELPGCMAHGDTQEAALRHVNEAMDLRIDTAKEFGDPIPKPRGERQAGAGVTAYREDSGGATGAC